MKLKLQRQLEIYKSSNYTLSTLDADDGLVLQLRFNSKKPEDVYTSFYPKTFNILRKAMPKVLMTECFNDSAKPFCHEVKNTELGHLFEHILIQKMTDIKKVRHALQIFDGMTSWDWDRHTYGTFNIWVSAGIKDLVAFFMAVTSSIHLFDEIINSNPQ